MKKVLLATMSLGIGGAETHILELALELRQRGIDVHIASNGGVFVSTLESAGAVHHTVPMHRRSISCMLKSFFAMRRLIKKEKPDVVHAHARIPGFICGLLNRVMRFVFVTTAHFDFETGHGLRYLTNWGKKTIAVSDDIKNYLIKYYNLIPDDIIVTVNAIDTARFSPNVSPAGIIEEFELDPSRPVICYVSRLDENAALAAGVLIDIAPQVAAKVPGAQFVIVGNGDIFELLSAKAAAANDAIGRKAVIMTGMRTDIDAILAAADLFVGVSRSALEALSEGKPVILAGNEGYLGLFTPELVKEAQETNFTCRGFGECTGERLLGDILAFFSARGESSDGETVNVKPLDGKEYENKSLNGKLLNDKASDSKTPYGKMSGSQIDALKVFGRELIVAEYSVKRMADDCLTAYELASQKQISVVMSGYYGFKNAGDEAILQSVQQSIKSVRSDITITVLSSDPADTMTHYGCRAVNRFNIIRVLRALRRCDALVSGGGSLLQDYTSTRSLMYYLFIINSAKRMGKKVMIYSNGIGPIRKDANRRRVRRAVNRADIVTLRDAASKDELLQIGVTRDDIRVTADPVFTMPRPSRDDALFLLIRHGIPDKPFITISLRDWQGMGDFCEAMASVCDSVYESSGRNIVFVSMQPDKDAGINQRVREAMRSPSFAVADRLGAEDLMAIIGESEALVAMRLHALIFAARMGVPFAGLVYDPKVFAYTEALGMPAAGDVTSFNRDFALAAILDLLSHRERYASLLQGKSDAMERAAMQDPALLLSLLNRKSY